MIRYNRSFPGRTCNKFETRASRARRKMKRQHACQELVLPPEVWLFVLHGLSVKQLYRLRTVCQSILVVLPLAVSRIKTRDIDCIKRSLLESFVNLRVIDLSRPLGYRPQDKSLYQFPMKPLRPMLPLQALQALHVFDNDLIDCPRVVSLLTNLTDLSLSDRTLVNDFHLLPLKNLRRLSIRYPINGRYKLIESPINESLTTLRNLESLSIIGNPHISCQTMARLTWLKSLSIRDVYISTECLESLVNLTSLDLTFHQLGVLLNPHSIANLPKLKHLTLTGFGAPFMQTLSQLTNPVFSERL